MRGIPVVYLSGGETDHGELAGCGVDLVAMGEAHILDRGLGAAVSGIHNRSVATFVADWIRANDTPATVYHVHGWSKILSPTLFRVLSVVSRRLVVHAHDFFLACPNGAYHDYQAGKVCERKPLGLSCMRTHCDKRSYAQKLWRSARSLSLASSLPRHGSHRILMLHEGMQPFLERAGYPGSALHTVRNPVRPFTSQRVRAEANTAFLFVGRLVPEKGIEAFLAAADALNHAAIVVGDGPLRETLEQRHPSAKFTGWLAREDIVAMAASARALVMPTQYAEPFGLVTAEASFSGLPVILSDRALLAADVDAAGIGLSYPGDDPSALEEAMAGFAAMSDAETKAMSLRAFARAGRIAQTPEAWCEALLGHYRDVLATTAADGLRP
ncbi:glycosyltransferase [Aurantimonas manganoxydans]|nr:glycosyltransferase [Aurantimonas manganoxydans]